MCEDNNDKCEKLANLGFCDPLHSHLKYMKRACRKSCKFCTNEEKNEKKFDGKEEKLDVKEDKLDVKEEKINEQP